jgi:ABC-type antimicrobial peptide transport system permease subunit
MRTIKIFAIGVVLVLGMCMVGSAATGHATIIHKTTSIGANTHVSGTSGIISGNNHHNIVPAYFVSAQPINKLKNR